MGPCLSDDPDVLFVIWRIQVRPQLVARNPAHGFDQQNVFRWNSFALDPRSHNALPLAECSGKS